MLKSLVTFALCWMIYDLWMSDKEITFKIAFTGIYAIYAIVLVRSIWKRLHGFYEKVDITTAWTSDR